MEDLPKIVQERLATATPGDHLEANLLAAFSENSLTPRERDEVLRHLAVCPACREIISLALPQPEEALAAVAVGGPASAPAFPPRGFDLRWGALAACAVIVAGVVWFTRHPAERLAAVLPTGTVSSSKPLDQQVAQVAEEASPVGYKAQQSASPEHASGGGAAKTPLAKSRGEIGLFAKESRPASMAMADAPRSPSPLPPDAAPSNDNTEAREIIALPATPNTQVNLGSTGRAGPAPAPARQKQEVLDEKDKKAVVSGSTFNATGAETTLAATRLDAFVRWTLSDGQLRRSADAGLSWDVVPIDHEAKFRALSVLGQELWVGGKDGVLYHSSDNGAHWVHVIPSAADRSLIEDIVRLEFSDTNHGRLITPHSEWTTTNGGVTWRRNQKR
jgi:hypothetical protein